MNKFKTGKYKHYKDKPYEVLEVAIHSETLEKLLVYRALYNSPEFWENKLWVRPYDMFFGNVIVDWVENPRFEYIWD